jgi:hypothetical protein
MVRSLSIFLWAGMGAGCGELPAALGKMAAGDPVLPLAEVLSQEEELVGALVTTEGTLEEVCPTAGCWAVLREGSSLMRLELTSFTLTRDYRGRHCRVYGKLVGTETPKIYVRGLELLNPR